MASVTYRLLEQLDDEDIPIILSMYRLPSISQFISIDEENYWRYITAADNVYFYKVYKDDAFAATVHLELDGLVLYMDVVVFPEYQKKGIATQVLKDIQEDKLLSGFDKIQVSIDEKNIASLKLFENAGFVCAGKDEELWEYEYFSG